jgi:hypothetical protein
VPVPDQIAHGKLPKRVDGRTLSLPSVLTERRTHTAHVDNERFVQRWGMLGNDQVKDCTTAAAGHAEMLWASKHGKPVKDPTKAQILAAYSKITGYDSADPMTDKGADLLSVLKYWQSKGIAGQKIGAFAEIPPSELDTIRWTIDKLDLAYIGLQLPAAWEVAHVRGGPQSQFATLKQRWKPATWQNPLYGHCVIYAGYGPDDTFTCVSWGGVMTVTVAFHQAYCDEAYAIIAPEHLHRNKPAGLDTEKLSKRLAYVKSVPSGRPAPA